MGDLIRARLHEHGGSPPRRNHISITVRDTPKCRSQDHWAMVPDGARTSLLAADLQRYFDSEAIRDDWSFSVGFV